MIDALSPHLADFTKDLQRLRGLLGLIKELREFGSIAPPDINGDGEFGQQSRRLRDQIRGLSPEIPIASGTLLLFLAGRFEHFVRQSFEAVCDIYAARCQKFTDLPDKMRTNLISYTAEVIASPGKYGFGEVEVYSFVSNLASNIEAEKGVGIVNSACLSVTTNNMTPGILADLFKRLGITNLWSEISKQAKMKLYLQLEKDSDVDKEARSRLENLMEMRNQIAHPNASSSFPAPEKVEGYIDFLENLAPVLIDVCRVQIAVFKQAG